MTATCKICGGGSRYLCATPNEHGELHTIHHYRCRDCGLVFVGDAVTNDQLGAAYATLDTKSYYREVGETEERKFATSLRDLQQLARPPVRPSARPPVRPSARPPVSSTSARGTVLSCSLQKHGASRISAVMTFPAKIRRS